MLNNKNIKGFLVFVSTYSIAFGVKIDGFQDRQLGLPQGTLVSALPITDTEFSGEIKRAPLSARYSFQDTTSDPGQTLLHYSGSNTGTSKIAYTLGNDFDLTSNSIFQLNFNSVNKDFNTKIILANLDGTQRTSNNIAVGLGNLNPNIDLTQSGNFTDQIGDPFNPSQVRSFQFLMNADPTASVTFDLDSIEAVPEPFSMISLGAGVAGLVKKRRKNRYKNTL